MNGIRKPKQRIAEQNTTEQNRTEQQNAEIVHTVPELGVDSFILP